MHQSKIADWERLRADFPILEQNVNRHPLIYFDNAATTQKPRAVIEALRHYYENDNANVHRGLHKCGKAESTGIEHLSMSKALVSGPEQPLVSSRGILL